MTEPNIRGEEITHKHLARQADLIPIKILNTKVNVIGCGAIGSFTALNLAKMGFTNIEVWDPDIVSIENMSSQFYRFADIDKPKVRALKELIKDFTGTEIKTNFALYEDGALDGIIVAAVDSMSARKTIWEQNKNHAINCQALIDPRMGAETAALYIYHPMTSKDEYEKTLYTDDDAVQAPCTAKATIYCATMLSGLVVKAIKQILVNGEIPWNQAQWSIIHDEFEIPGRYKKSINEVPYTSPATGVWDAAATAYHNSYFVPARAQPTQNIDGTLTTPIRYGQFWNASPEIQQIDPQGVAIDHTQEPSF